MEILDPADRAKLAKLLAMMGSPAVGEVLNAAGAAHRLVQSRGLTWDAILAQEPPAKEISQLSGWRLTVDRCLRQADRLSDKEFGFLFSLSGWARRSLTEKQQSWLDQIAYRVLDGQS